MGMRLVRCETDPELIQSQVCHNRGYNSGSQVNTRRVLFQVVALPAAQGCDPILPP